MEVRQSGLPLFCGLLLFAASGGASAKTFSTIHTEAEPQELAASTHPSGPMTLALGTNKGHQKPVRQEQTDPIPGIDVVVKKKGCRDSKGNVIPCPLRTAPNGHTRTQRN